MKKEKIVTTISGKKVPISKTRRYDSTYYEIGDINIKDSGDCYLMYDGRYHKENLGNIVYDHFLEKYVFIHENSLLQGIIDEKGNKGYFSNNPNVVTVYDQNSTKNYYLNSKLLENQYEYREHLATGNFYHISTLQAVEFVDKQPVDVSYKQSLKYNVENSISKVYNVFNRFNKSDYNIDKYIIDLLGDLTFGLEFETVKGSIPDRICDKLGLIPLRDGSIQGLEYATIPLSGKKGLSVIKDICSELEKRTEYDHTCSLHLHIGNVPRTKEFILAFFKIICYFQEDYFKLFPLYKKYNYGYKNKNYTAPYNLINTFAKLYEDVTDNNIDFVFNKLFIMLSGGASFNSYNNDLNNVKVHPHDPGSNHKWNIHERYYFINLIPLLFGNKQTIEFRIHTPTTNFEKIAWFMILNSVIINFVKSNQNNILKNKDWIYSLGSLRDFLSSNISILRKSENFRLYDNFFNYYENRVQQILSNNKQSKIFENDEFIRCPFYVIEREAFFKPWKPNLTNSKRIVIKKDDSSKFDQDLLEETPIISYKDAYSDISTMSDFRITTSSETTGSTTSTINLDRIKFDEYVKMITKIKSSIDEDSGNADTW